MSLSIKHLNFRFLAQSPLIEDFSLSIQPGEITALVGLSGSGKTTLIQLIAGLMKPLSGTIQVGNHVVFDAHTNVPPQQRQVGVVFQDYALFPHFTVQQNMMFGMKGTKVDKQNQLHELVTLLDIASLVDRYPYQLSGGQMQRVAIARSLAVKPKVLLLDEPFSNLDSTLIRRLRTDLKKILTQLNIAVLLVTHDPMDTSDMANHTVNLGPLSSTLKR
jgi:iron(III) transport system ATP-binding protein